jgi:zinc/manganese transport system substrate-binding protein
MIHRLLPAVVVAAILALTGCHPGDEAERPRVIVTTNILGDVVKAVVGDQAEVTTLMKPNADPHSFEVSAQDAARMDTADLLVSNGLGLEEGLQQHLDRAADAGVPEVIAGDHVDVLAYGTEAGAGTPDPHFWTDPRQMLRVVDAVEAAIIDIPGIDPETIRSSADAYRTELDRLDAEMVDAFGAIPAGRRALVTNHHVFGYLAERFGFRVVGAVLPSGTTLAAPSAADLRELAKAIEDARVTTIFAESSQPDRLVQVLANEVGLEVDVVELFTESLTERGEGADTYLTMMRANTERIARGLTH